MKNSSVTSWDRTIDLPILLQRVREKILQMHHKTVQDNIVVVWSSLPIRSTDVPKRVRVIYLPDKVKAVPLQA